MGGLNGFPFTGFTGKGAFASRVPDGGAGSINYSPHIGITKTGAPGEINRYGQVNDTVCCGAARKALVKLMNDEMIDGHITEQSLFKEKARISNAEAPLYEATEVIYEAIDKRIHELIEQTEYHCA